MVNLPAQNSMAERRANILSELVRLFSSGKDPVGLAEAAVELVAAATGAKSVFVYFWDPEIERLVLRIVTQSDVDLTSHHVQMRLGEGITGWSGLHRKSVVLNSDIRKDPRFLEVQDVNEQDYGSTIIVPIYDDSDLYGVFALYASEQDAFGDLELALAEEVGLLLASGLNRAETVHQLEIQSATASFLTDLPTSAISSTPAALRYSASRVLELLEAEACIISYPPSSGVSTEQTLVAERTKDPSNHSIKLTSAQFAARDAEQQFTSRGLNHISAPLGHGFSRGLVTCFRMKPFVSEDSYRLNVLTTQISLLLDNSGALPRGALPMLRALTSEDDVVITASLKQLGWNEHNVLPALLDLQTIGENIDMLSGALHESITHTFGVDTLLMQSGSEILLLAPAPMVNSREQIMQLFDRWVDHLNSTYAIVVKVGIGETLDLTNSIGISLSQAQQALAWSQVTSARKQTDVVHFSSVENVTQLPVVIETLRPDIEAHLPGLMKLLEYDVRHNTKLLETLEVFSSFGGSVVKTSEALFVHRNTLRQRLSRIEELLGLDLSDDAQWVELVLAAKLIRSTHLS